MLILGAGGGGGRRKKKEEGKIQNCYEVIGLPMKGRETMDQTASAGICIRTSAPVFSLARCEPASGRMRSTK